MFNIDKVPKIVERIEFTWILHEHTETFKRYKNGMQMLSPIFPDTDRKDHWTLVYYPNGKEYEEGNVVIYLTLAEMCGNVHEKYRLTVRNSRDKLIAKKEIPKEIPYGERDLLRRYHSLSSSLCTCAHLRSMIGQDDILKINVMVFVEVFTLYPYHILPIQEKNNEASKISSKLGGLLETGEFSDFTFKLADSVEVPVHRNILAASSPVFKAMLQLKLAENNLGFAEIKDTDKDSMMHLLKFIYTNHIDDLSVDAAIKLLQLADKYEILDLKERCSKVLMGNLEVSNALDVLKIADLHHIDELKRAASEYILVKRSEAEVHSTEETSELFNLEHDGFCKEMARGQSKVESNAKKRRRRNEEANRLQHENAKYRGSPMLPFVGFNQQNKKSFSIKKF